jgi:nitrite reductase/ring-hydroxylating ferredoxin subunit
MPEPARLTIAARTYSDRQYVFTENERLWRKAWLLVAATDQVVEPGDFTETRFGLAPTMLVRGDDGRLRGFENVCQHQGAPLCLGSGGGLTEIECKNHRWAWDLAGRLKAVDFGQPVGGGEQDIPLQPLVIETWGPFVFGTFDPGAPPLLDAIASLVATLEDAGVDPAGLRCRSVVSTLVGGNWKSLLDGATAIGDVPDLGVRQYPDLAVRVTDGVVTIVRARPYVSIDRAQFDVLVFEPRPGDAGDARHRPLEVTLKGDAELPAETGVDPALIEYARRQVGAVPPTDDLTADASTPDLLALHTWLGAFGVTGD